MTWASLSENNHMGIHALPKLMDVRLFFGSDFVEVAIEAPGLDKGLKHEYQIRVCSVKKKSSCNHVQVLRENWITVRAQLIIGYCRFVMSIIFFLLRESSSVHCILDCVSPARTSTETDVWDSLLGEGSSMDRFEAENIRGSCIQKYI